MLIDGISRLGLQSIAIAALQAGGTLAGSRVFEATDWPTKPDLFPMLMVSAPKERKIGIYPGQLTFNTTITLNVVGRILLPLNLDTVNDVMETFAEQIVNAIYLSAAMNLAVQQYASVDCQHAVSSDGKYLVGEVGVGFEVVVFQEYGATGEPLTKITATGTIVGGSGTPEPTIQVELLPVTIGTTP